jgi:uncharacterized protein (TIGR02145 family)
LCYDKIDGFCDTFGRFYSLHINGEYFDLFDQDLLDTICPAGWHVPSVDEWSLLANNMGGEEKAGLRLMSSLDFGERDTKGTDDCEFNSLPAGSWLLDGTLATSSYVNASYWTSTNKSMDVSYEVLIGVFGVELGNNMPKMTVRCVKD